jgi:hypothetical protein
VPEQDGVPVDTANLDEWYNGSFCMIWFESGSYLDDDFAVLEPS